MTRLYPWHKLPQFWELASRSVNKQILELKINCTLNNQDDAGQTTDNQFEDDCQSWLAISASRPLRLSIKALVTLDASWGKVGLWTDVCHHPHQLPASEIKQTFFSTDLTCLEAFEWQAAGPHLTLSVTAGISKWIPDLLPNPVSPGAEENSFLFLFSTLAPLIF